MLRSKCCLDRIGIVRAGQVLTIARPRMRSRAEPALLPCRDPPPGQLVAGPAWRGSRAFRGPGASEEIANAVGRRVALAALSASFVGLRRETRVAGVAGEPAESHAALLLAAPRGWVRS